MVRLFIVKGTKGKEKMVAYENQILTRQIETLYKNVPSIVLLVCFA